MKEEKLLKRLFKYAGAYKILTVLGIILAGFSSITSMLPIYYIWKVADEVINSYPNYYDNQNIYKYAILAVAFAIITLAVYLVGLLISHLSAFRIARNLRTESLKKLMQLPLGFFSKTGSGKLRQVIDECAANTETLLAHNLPDLAAAIVSPIAIFGIIFIFDYRLGLVSIIPLILSIFSMSMMFASKGMKDKTMEKQEVLSSMNNEAIEYVRGIPVLKTFGQTIYSFKRFHQSIIRYNDFATEISVKGKYPMIGFESMINSSPIFLTIAGVLFIASTPILIEFLSMFLFGVLLLPLTTTAMYKTMYLSHNTMQTRNSLNSIENLLGEEMLSETKDGKVPTSFDISFSSVDFSYPNTNKKAIDNITIEIPMGKTYGLVGPSGGGKTTFASLIARFFDPNSGSIKIGGVDIREINKEVLMNNISFVFQQTNLYKMSIKDNVKESKPDASDAEVLKALKDAQCMPFIDKLPNGIDTIYGTKGTYLSGGEAQRIAIARAILKDAPIILLDEATSFTDPENEFEIKKAFESLTRNKTVIMVAHRLTSIINADQICYLNDGKILEQGTHDELMDKNGLYHDLYKEYQEAFLWNGGQN